MQMSSSNPSSQPASPGCSAGAIRAEAWRRDHDYPKDWFRRGNRGVRENHPDCTNRDWEVQKTVKITDHRSEIQNIATHSLSLISSAGKDSSDELKISTAIKKDLEPNTTDIPVVRQRQVLAIQKAQIFHCFRTLTQPSTSQVQKQRRTDTTETAWRQQRLFADEARVPGACPRANRRTDHRGASATADFGKDRNRDEVGPTWTHTSRRVSPATVHQQGCWRSRDDADTSPTVQVGMSQSSREVSGWHRQKWWIPVVQQRTDNRGQMPQFQRVLKKSEILSIRPPELGTSIVSGAMYSARDQRDHLSRLDQEGNGDAGGSRTPQTWGDLAEVKETSWATRLRRWWTTFISSRSRSTRSIKAEAHKRSTSMSPTMSELRTSRRPRKSKKRKTPTT